MKVCQYCDTLCKEDVSVCPACGGNAFSYRCRNCGTLFEQGSVCPACGVRRDVPARRCPNCRRFYYTAACPDCGYTPAATPAEKSAPQQKQPAKIWLWVLGFLFCYPIPLTVLIVRSGRMEKWLKILLISLLWGVYLLIGVMQGISS